MLRAVTFHENEKRRQIMGMRSSRMRLPALGARGCMSAAGDSRSVDAAAAQVAISVMPMDSPADSTASPESIGVGRCGTAYTIE